MPQSHTIITQTVQNRLRIPPQNLEAEMALLGSIMLRPEALFDITDVVNQDSFYSEKHRIIYETMMELFTKHSPIDLLSVSAKLKEKGWLDQIGGNTYLTEIVNSVPSSSNIGYYAQIVQKKYMMRRLIEASDHISQIGYDENKELEEMLDNAEKKLFDVTNFNTAHKFIPIKDELTEAWERLDRLHSDDKGLRGIPTGFDAIDNKLSGLQKSDLIILAARPSVGKTSFALDIARQAAVNHNIPVGIFSLEMSSQQLVDRMLAAQANVDAWKLRTGKLSRQDDFEAIRESLDKLNKAPIFIDDQPGNNILKMRSIARRLKSEHGLGLIVVITCSSWFRHKQKMTTLFSKLLKYPAHLKILLVNWMFQYWPFLNFPVLLNSVEVALDYLTLGIQVLLNRMLMLLCLFTVRINIKRNQKGQTLLRFLSRNIEMVRLESLNYTSTKRKRHSRVWINLTMAERTRNLVNFNYG